MNLIKVIDKVVWVLSYFSILALLDPITLESQYYRMKFTIIHYHNNVEKTRKSDISIYDSSHWLIDHNWDVWACLKTSTDYITCYCNIQWAIKCRSAGERWKFRSELVYSRYCNHFVEQWRSMSIFLFDTSFIPPLTYDCQLRTNMYMRGTHAHSPLY